MTDETKPDPLAVTAPQAETDPSLVSPPVRRGPGRPPGSRNKLNGSEPETAADPGGFGTIKRGPGRPRKSAPAFDVSAMAEQIKGLHLIAAMATNIPELVLDDKSAQMLAQGIGAVTKEYGLDLSGKTGAALQLFGAAAIIYVPRFIAMKKRVIATQQAMDSAAAEIVNTVIPNDGTPSTH